MANQKKRDIKFDEIRIKRVTGYFDRADVETLLSRLHPLGTKKAIGRRMCYVASYRGEWLAVLLFDRAALRNKHREARIGWNKGQLAARIQHIANNSRFLMLPAYQGVKNLASKILSLATDRISDDWMKHYGVPLLAVETYVDPQHNDNQGTCYLAAGWEKLGLSSGYEAYNEERTSGKWYFLKGLHRDSYAALRAEIPHALLSGVKNVSGESNNNYVLDASKIKLQELRIALAQIEDPRGKQGVRYPFVPLLSLCICAVISGYTQYRQIADWIKKLPAPDRVRFGMPGHRTPDESTIGDFIRAIDPVQLQQALQHWLQQTYKKDIDFKEVSLDGKALRGTSADAGQQSAVLNVFATELGIVIEHLPTQKGGGEKNAARQFLNSGMDLSNKVVLADAIHTDQQLVETLEKKTLRMSLLSRRISRLSSGS